MENDQFMKFFRRVTKDNVGINLINVYKGVPIAYPATIFQVGQDSIKVKTEAFQIVCLHRDRETFIQSKYFPTVIKARVVKVDFVKACAELSGFEVVKGNIGNREQVRVVPADPIAGVVHREGEDATYRGELADISLDGMGIYLAREDYSPAIFRINSRIIVILRLPIEGVLPPSTSETLPEHTSLQFRFDDVRARTDVPRQLEATPAIWGADVTHRRRLSSEFRVEGVLVNLREEKKSNRYRFGLRLLPWGSSRAIISKFIVQRQSEIIREVRTLYDMLSRLAVD
jgi:hypothetical protein